MKKSMILAMGVALIMSLSGCATSEWYKLPPLDFDEVDYGYETRSVQVRNINVAYVDEGSGEQTLLLVHGLGSNAKGWLNNIPDWARDHRVIAVDLPGYGKSDKGYYEYSLSFYCTVLAEMLDELDIDTVTMVGHSMGGQIAMIMSLQHPDVVDGLVLVSPAGVERFLDGEGHWLRNVLKPEFVQDTPIRSIAINLENNFYDAPPEAEFMITDRIQVRGAKDFERYCYAVSKNVGAMIDEPMWDKLDRITHPTLLIFGENDGLIPNPYLHGGWTADIAQIGAEKIAGSRVLVIPECGHFAQFEKPDETNTAVREFMAGL